MAQKTKLKVFRSGHAGWLKSRWLMESGRSRGRGSRSNISSHTAWLQSRLWWAISSPDARQHHPADKQWDYTNTWQLKSQPSGYPLQIYLWMWFWLLSTPSHLSYSTSAVGWEEQKLHRLLWQQKGPDLLRAAVHSRGNTDSDGSPPSRDVHMCMTDPSSSAWEQSPFDVPALFLGIGFHVQEGTALFLSPACQTTTETLTINLNT